MLLSFEFRHLCQVDIFIQFLLLKLTGTIPNYMDVVFNLAQTRFKEDNWLIRAKDAGYR